MNRREILKIFLGALALLTKDGLGKSPTRNTHLIGLLDEFNELVSSQQDELSNKIYLPLIMSDWAPSIYASPTGAADAAGTQSDPVDLNTGLRISTNRLYLLDGIYTVSETLVIPPITVIGIGRPIITHSDGYPPAVSIKNKANISGIWFGGNKFPDENGRVIFIGQDVIVQNCTFWGYSQCLTPGSSGARDIYLKNRFVNCGYLDHYHDLYISNGSDTYDQIRENIHVGGGGFKIHLYHNPEQVIIRGNFMGGCTHSDLAVQQGYHTISNNILWNAVVSYWNAENCVFDKNIIGPDRTAFFNVTRQAGNTANGNVFCNGQLPFGSNPQIWDEAAIVMNLGYTSTDIDTAVGSLISKFGKTMRQIHDDVTIEDDFSVLRGVIDTWKDK